MVYQIIARKYRPKNFDEVVGQEVVIQTLKNSILLKKVGQAYLFSGPRGVGKTTIARILGKVLNCQKKQIIPCEECPHCREMQSNSSLDYYEIDGASNRGIDQIREINSNLNYASPTGNYRIYVIDEVHMLTIEAFNALLKSLEEPPKKTIFVLCTTEVNKIPLTIRSRCQNFQLQNIANEKIAHHLEKIGKQEKIKFAEGAFFNIAKRAQGSVRDAENLLEQVLLYSEDKITVAIVNRALGEVAFDIKIEFLKNLYLDNLSHNQNIIKTLAEQGSQLEDFLFRLLEVFTHLVFLKNDAKNTKLLELIPDELSALEEIKNHFSLGEVFTLIDVLYDFIQEIKNTKFTSVTTSFFLIKLHRYKTLISASDLKENLLQLAKFITSDEKPLSEKTLKPEKTFPVSPTPINSTAGVNREINLTQETYTDILGKIKPQDIVNYRFNAGWLFKRYDASEKILYLYDQENLYQEKYRFHIDKLKSYVNQYLSQIKGEPINDIVIMKNMLQSSVDKVKKVFPKAEIL